MAARSPLDHFGIDYTLWLNLVFILLSAVAVGWVLKRFGKLPRMGSDWVERLLFILAIAGALWLLGGLALWVSGAASLPSG